MAKLETAPEQNHKKKRKRRNSTGNNGTSAKKIATDSAEQQQEEEERESIDIALTIPRSGTWKNLDLILSVRNREIPLQRKIELAFEFINSRDENDGGNSDYVQKPRLVAFLSDWIQSVLISSDKKKSFIVNGEELDSCLDFRCWCLFRFCLKEASYPSLSLSPNLLRSISRVPRHALLLSERNGFSELFEVVCDCVELLFSSYGRSFNANVDSWTSLAVTVFDFVYQAFSHNLTGCDASALLRLSCLILEPFANFLKVHPNPKNVFPVVVDRLLEPLLRLLVLLDGNSSASAGSLLKFVENVLSNGLFHPAHIDGFLCIRRSEKYGGSKDGTVGVKESKGDVVKSYHKHLFQKLRQLQAEKKTEGMLGGVGKLLLLFVTRVRKQKVASLLSGSGKRTGKGGNVDTIPNSEVSQLSARRLDEETSKSVFDMFVLFMEPLLLDVKRYSELECSEVGEFSASMLSGVLCTLKSANKILASLMQGKIYIRTEDTSEGAHLNFLKELCDTVILFSAKIQVLWSSALKVDRGYAETLQLISKEVIVALQFFLEIEYKVLGDDLVGLWFLMLSFMAIDLSVANKQLSCLLVPEILHLGRQLINVYSDLRQVNSPFFALCKAVRLFGFPSHEDELRFISSIPILSSEVCLKSVETLICSQGFRLVISAAIKSIPEGQASVCIWELKEDIIECLDWMKTYSPRTVRTEAEEGNIGDNSILDLKAVLLGKCVSELYTLILDSSTVTAGNSILVGNSIKDLMLALTPSFSSLVREESCSVDKFLLSVTGGRLFNHKIPDGKVHSLSQLCSSWVLVFFFRIYVSCRSLFRQSISLMPPNLSRKASAAMEDLFTAYSGKDCLERTDWINGGYFSWILKPSTSLLAVIQSVSDSFLQDSVVGYSSLVYVLYVMAFQRLADLNRHIKAFEFLLDKGARLTQIRLLDDFRSQLPKKESKKWKRLSLASRKEAAELTSFLTGYLPSMVAKGQCVSIKSVVADEKKEKVGVDEDHAWDLGLCSIGDESLPTAIFWLLCQNTDAWCPHATETNLRKFLSFLIGHSLPCFSGFRDIEEPNIEEGGCPHKVTLHSISLGLIRDTILYEQTCLRRHLVSRFCHILKKSLLPLSGHLIPHGFDFKKLPDWSEVSSVLEKDPVVGIGYKHNLHDGCAVIQLNSHPSNLPPLDCYQVISCQSLLNLLCWMPKGHAKSRHILVYATYILNIERIVVPSLLNCPAELFLDNQYELFKLFVCCRRALRYMVVESDDGNLEIGQSSLVSTLCEDSVLLWLLKSVSSIVGLSQVFSKEQTFKQVTDMIFSLMDHTSHIFLTLSGVHLNVGLQSLIYELKSCTEVHNCKNSNVGDNNMEAGLRSDSSEHYNVWKCVEPMAKLLKEQSRSLLVTLKDTVHNSKIDAVFSFVNWNTVSCMVSCFQGFLWGLASALNNLDKGKEPLGWKLGHISELNLCVNVFEDIVGYCFNTLLKDQSLQTESLDSLQETLSLEAALKTAFKFSGHNDDMSPGKQLKINLSDGIDVQPASDPEDDISANLGFNSAKNSIFTKRRLQSMLPNCSLDSLSEAHGVDAIQLQHLNKSLLRSLLKGESPDFAFLLGQVFIASAAFLQLKHLLFSPRVLKSHEHTKSIATSVTSLVGASHFVLSEFTAMVGRPHPFTFVVLDGIITYLEVLGRYFPASDPVLSRNLYALLLGIHIRAIGKCIALQGNAATLASHETESSTKTLQAQEGLSETNGSIGDSQYNLNEFKARLRMSFKMFIRRPPELHLLSAVQTLERALVGVHEDCKTIYEINTGSVDGGKVSSIVAAGIDCLDLVLESVEGRKRSSVVKRHIQSLINAVFNIVLHLQSPLIFSQEVSGRNSQPNPDPGSVILMCVEVLTKIAAKHSLYQMDPSHVAQSLSMATSLFKHFCQLRAFPSSPPSLAFSANQEMRNAAHGQPFIVDNQFTVELYAACCRLLYTILRHRKSDSERCIALLEDSVCILLYCLEMVDSGFISTKGCPAWEVQEGIKCASFLRRIYEEIRQQKDLIGKYAFHFLSTYIRIYSGYGPLKKGIRREIDEALRPGLYAIIDACSPADLQQLHTVLGEGPCRSTLATLQHDYKLNFQYEGKV